MIGSQWSDTAYIGRYGVLWTYLKNTKRRSVSLIDRLMLHTYLPYLTLHIALLVLPQSAKKVSLCTPATTMLVGPYPI